MARSLVCAKVLLAGCAWFLANHASAKPWWQDPVRKYDEVLIGISGSVDPHYMNKDEADQYLAMGTGSGGGSVFLYSIPELMAAGSSNDVAPIAKGDTSSFFNTAWKGIAVSDDLKRVLTGQTGTLPDHTSFPVTGPWVKNVNTFSITNDSTKVYFDGCDFSHTSEFLFSDVYKSDTNLVAKYTAIVKWSVTNLLSGGIGLVNHTVASTSIKRIRNVSSYFIGGKDLVYYGEGDTTATNVCKVCAYDFDPGTETVLVSNLPVGSADYDIMNVKVGGVGLGHMHLYVQDNVGNLYIYDLAADGKSVGALVKSFTAAEMKQLCGEAFVRIRNMEFTNDEKFAFFLHAPTATQTKLHIICAKPETTAWWYGPALRVKDDLVASAPQAINKDECDQYLFLSAGFSSSDAGRLYSIPVLTAAATADDVTPMACGKPSTFQPGTVIYQQDFDGITAPDTAAVTNILGWQICELFQKHTARYAISNGTLFVDNLDLAGLTSTDSYVVIKSSDYMKPFCTNDYSYQYDVTYRAASGTSASDSGTRYVSLLCNFTGTNVYNTMDLRYGGNGYNQFRYKIPNEWNHYSNDIWPIEATGTNSMLYLLYGQPYVSSSITTNALKDRTCTVRVEMSRANGPSVYVNGMLVSKTDTYLQYWDVTKDLAYAICLKPSRDIKCEIDNIMVWQGCGVEPVWKSGAVSSRMNRILTGGAGTVNVSLPLCGPWTNSAVAFSITNDPTLATASLDALDFSPTTNALYSYSDYFTRTNNLTSRLGYQHKIYKWDVLNLVSNGVGLASNAVFSTGLTQLRSLDAYAIGGKDLVYYGEGQVALAGAAKVCVLDPSTGTETVLINASTNAMPSNIVGVKVTGVGTEELHLYVQCENGALYIYELSDDGLSLGPLVRSFSPARIKALLGGVSFTTLRSFEVLNDETSAFFTFYGADGLYVVGGTGKMGTVMKMR